MPSGLVSKMVTFSTTPKGSQPAAHVAYQLLLEIRLYEEIRIDTATLRLLQGKHVLQHDDLQTDAALVFVLLRPTQVVHLLLHVHPAQFLRLVILVVAGSRRQDRIADIRLGPACFSSQTRPRTRGPSSCRYDYEKSREGIRVTERTVVLHLNGQLDGLLPQVADARISLQLPIFVAVQLYLRSTPADNPTRGVPFKFC